jgi:hypothetical protein
MKLIHSGSDPELLKWFAQAELMHSRWAMLGVTGILIPEILDNMGYVKNFSWFNAGSVQYFADPTTLFIVQLALMGWAEGRRWADIVNPGSVDIEPKLPNRPNPKPDVGYPGGLWFDPMQWGRGSPEPVMVLRTKEIKNGRLAMLAFLGFCFQAVYTGGSPLDNLMAHLADPGHVNIFSVINICYLSYSANFTRFHLCCLYYHIAVELCECYVGRKKKNPPYSASISALKRHGTDILHKLAMTVVNFPPPQSVMADI